MNELMKRLISMAGDKKIVEFETVYGSLYVVIGTDLRLEHHFKGEHYNFAIIVDADLVLHDIQL